MSNRYWQWAAGLFLLLAVGFFIRSTREHTYRMEAEAAASEYVQKLEACESARVR